MQFTLQTIINATTEAIYKAWLSSEGHTEMTGGEAEITDQVGDTFTAWDGYISGINLELEANRKIVQSWRTTEFEEGQEDSQIEVLLKEVNGQTEITLIHTQLSEQDEHYKKGWEDFYFKPMRAYFGE